MLGDRKQPFRWQLDAEADYLGKLKKDYLLVATPGAGKTFWTLRIARQLMAAGRIKRLVVVVPNAEVKTQWARTASREVGLTLTADYQNSDGSWPRDCDGVVMTYAQVFTERALHRHNVSKAPTLVVMDEVHHLGDRAGWGDAAQEAFEMAAFRIHLSGTPWRTSGKIPWIEYNTDGESIADFTFSYGDSLAAGVNCDVFFPKFGGRAEWSFDGELYRGSLEDEDLSTEDESRILKTYVHPTKSDFVKRAFEQADQELSAIRGAGQDRAGGLILALNIAYAEEIAKLIERATGRRPEVVHSDDPLSHQKIRKFRQGADRWLVSVRQVNEGVDIPRLRVLLFATNITTRLFFQQAVGRVIRGPVPPAAVYIPAHRALLRWAQEIYEMRVEALRETEERETESRETDPPVFEEIGAEATPAGVIHGGGSVTEFELENAREQWRLLVGDGSVLDDRTATGVAKMLRREGQQELFEEVRQPEPPTIDEQKKALRLGMKKILGAYAYRTANGESTGEIIKDANARLNSAVGIVRIRDATLEELRRRFELAKKLYGRSAT